MLACPWRLLGVLLVLAAPAIADAYAVRLRWAPSPSQVAGYHVHTRSTDEDYAQPVDVGLPAAAGDGTLEWVVPDLDPERDYAFAVSAYRADGGESGLSNELQLPRPPRPCGADADCVDRDVCTLNERCQDGLCTWEPLACTAADPCGSATCHHRLGCGRGGEALTVSRFVVRTAGRRQQLFAHGSFAPKPGLAPRDTGATVEVRDADGGVVWAGEVPGASLARRRGHAFHYGVARGKKAKGPPGLTKLVLALDDEATDVGIALSLRGHPLSMQDQRLSWVLRVGEMCARNADLVCARSAPGRLRCE